MLSDLWNDVQYRVRALLRRTALERDLEDELRFHLERETEKYVVRGMGRVEAERRARLAFGGVERIKDDVRDERGTVWLEQVLQDFRHAWRGLSARPGFSTAVVLTLALGVGVNAAMFGVLDRLLFRAPARLVDPESVHRVYLSWTSNGQSITSRRTEFPTFADLTRWSTTFSVTSAFAYRDEAVGTGSTVEERVVAAVSGTFFDFFSARPVIGRFFTRQHDVPPHGSKVAVLTHAYWQSHYGGGSDVIGTNIRVGREAYEVIGVAPPDFVGIADQRVPVVFVPITAYGVSVRPTYATRYSWTFAEMLVRRNTGVTVEAATTDLNHAYRRSWRQLESAQTPTFEAAQARAQIGPLQVARGPQAGPDSRVVLWVSGVALLVLLIACANVSNLMLLRALRRRRELVMRTALGATRLRIVQQLGIETLVLTAVGCVGGLVFAHWAGAALRRLFLDASTPADVFADGRTLLFAATITLVSALLAGLLPALLTTRLNLADSLKAGTREAPYRRSRARSALLITQTALCAVLLIGAGLFVRSLHELRSMRLGYDVEPIVYVLARFRDQQPSPAERTSLIRRLVDEARKVPGVVSATPVISVPFIGGERQDIFVPGHDSVAHLGRFSLQAGSPDYFATTGTRVLRGRGIQASDLANGPRVAVVTQAMADALWPGRDAIGQCFRIQSDTVPCTTVVGITEDIRMHSLTAAREFHYFLAETQYSLQGSGAPEEALLRTTGNAADYVEIVRQQLQSIMPGSSYVVVNPLSQFTSPQVRSWQIGATLFLIFGALALVVAAVGLYAVISFGVAQRMHELGIRVALGARTGDTVRLVVGEAVRLTIAGLAIGSAIALSLSRWITPLLFEVSPRDPMVYALVSLTLLSAGIVATALPASRATRVDPNRTVRVE